LDAAETDASGQEEREAREHDRKRRTAAQARVDAAHDADEERREERGELVARGEARNLRRAPADDAGDKHDRETPRARVERDGEADGDGCDRECRAEIEHGRTARDRPQDLGRDQAEGLHRAFADRDAHAQHDERGRRTDEARASRREVPRREFAHRGRKRKAGKQRDESGERHDRQRDRPAETREQHHDERRHDRRDHRAAELREQFALAATARESDRKSDGEPDGDRRDHLGRTAAEEARGAAGEERVADRRRREVRLPALRADALELGERAGRVEFARDEAVGDAVRLLEQRQLRSSRIYAEVHGALDPVGTRAAILDGDVDPGGQREDRDRDAEPVGACGDEALDPLCGSSRLVQHARELREEAVAVGLAAGGCRRGAVGDVVFRGHRGNVAAKAPRRSPAHIACAYRPHISPAHR